jgi:hypothetical protein
VYATAVKDCKSCKVATLNPVRCWAFNIVIVVSVFIASDLSGPDPRRFPAHLKIQAGEIE